MCLKQLEKYYESEYGGFSGAPKFPQPVNLNFLLHMYARDPNKEWGSSSLKMCEHTLKKMANGGIRDHVGQVKYQNKHYIVRWKNEIFNFHQYLGVCEVFGRQEMACSTL